MVRQLEAENREDRVKEELRLLSPVVEMYKRWDAQEAQDRADRLETRDAPMMTFYGVETDILNELDARVGYAKATLQARPAESGGVVPSGSIEEIKSILQDNSVITAANSWECTEQLQLRLAVSGYTIGTFQDIAGTDDRESAALTYKGDYQVGKVCVEWRLGAGSGCVELHCKWVSGD